MRILVGVLGVWGAVAVGIVVLLVVRSKGEPDASAKAPPPLSCATLAARAKECQKELLDTTGDFVEVASRRAGSSPLAAGGRRLLVTGFLQNVITSDEAERQCTKHWDSRWPLVVRLRGELARCWVRRGCAAFTTCLRRVAEAEEAAGRLPL